jgi:iron(III) transport system ATP-binding protein
MTTLTLDAITKVFPRAGKVADGVTLHVENGEFFTLLGPSGCGKSTILRMIAGFEEPSSGRILFDGHDMTHDPPNRRNIGFVFQNYALFPHMSVAENISFGLEVRGVPRITIRERVAAVLRQMHLERMEKVRIDQLSGGQQQRIALARALVIKPRLLLLDEPLSNLDARLREETRATLRELHVSTGVTTIFVTHDQTEAMSMSSHIAILEAGRVQQVATPQQIYHQPASRFVAKFIGRSNLLDATIVNVNEQFIVVRFANGYELLTDIHRRAQGVSTTIGERVAVCVRAEEFRVAGESGAFQGLITDVEYSGSARSYAVTTDVGDLCFEVSDSSSKPSKGDRVKLTPMFGAAHLVATS